MLIKVNIIWVVRVKSFPITNLVNVKQFSGFLTSYVSHFYFLRQNQAIFANKFDWYNHDVILSYWLTSKLLFFRGYIKGAEHCIRHTLLLPSMAMYPPPYNIPFYPISPSISTFVYHWLPSIYTLPSKLRMNLLIVPFICTFISHLLLSVLLVYLISPQLWGWRELLLPL